MDLKRSSKLTAWKVGGPGGGEVADGPDRLEPVLPVGPAGTATGEDELAGEPFAADLSIARSGLSILSWSERASQGE